MRKIILGLGLSVLVAVVFAAGYWVGRSTLERQWRLPPTTLTDNDVSEMKQGDADPVPPAGTKIVGAMPLQRAREAMREFTAKDPVKAIIGSIGRGDEGAEGTVVLKSDVDCEIQSIEGVVYG